MGPISAIENLESKIISKLEIRTTTDGSSALAFGQCSDWHRGYVFFVVEKK